MQQRRMHSLKNNMNDTQIEELIAYCKSNSNLGAIFSDQVAYHAFVNEKEEGNMLLIRDLSDNRKLSS